jgi:hypothetical protein
MKSLLQGAFGSCDLDRVSSDFHLDTRWYRHR